MLKPAFGCPVFLASLTEEAPPALCFLTTLSVFIWLQKCGFSFSWLWIWFLLVSLVLWGALLSRFIYLFGWGSFLLYIFLHSTLLLQSMLVSLFICFKEFLYLCFDLFNGILFTEEQAVQFSCIDFNVSFIDFWYYFIVIGKDSRYNVDFKN